MKILLFLLSLTFLNNVEWVNDLNSTIEKINKEAIIKKEKSNKTKSEQTVIKKYKLKDYKKIELNGSGTFIDTFNFQYFSKGNFVFAQMDFIIADYFHKGANYSGRAKGEITENKFYFKNEKEGIKLRRTIDYYENSNIDSLIPDLQRKNFDTTLIGNDEYLVTKKSFKKISKRC